jgi:hypothetical protein
MVIVLRLGFVSGPSVIENILQPIIAFVTGKFEHGLIGLLHFDSHGPRLNEGIRVSDGVLVQQLIL